MGSGIVLLEVIDRHTRKGILPIEEREFPRYDNEGAFYFEHRAKRVYLDEIEARIRYQPRVKSLLNGREWCIDCTILD